MLQDQFVCRLLLIVVFGVAYIYTMMNSTYLSCTPVRQFPKQFRWQVATPWKHHHRNTLY